MARFPRPRFSLKTIMLLSLGFALGYAWNLWVWRFHALPGTEANMVNLPTYVIEPPDVLSIDVTTDSGVPLAPAIGGQHLVAMDGRVNLGKYGSVYVAGMTIDEAIDSIKEKLAGQVDQPKVVVDVLAYNSKVYYVILEGRGLGDDVTRMPITGNDTVLDAIAALGTMPKPESVEITIARPSLNGVGCETITPVDWKALANNGVASANYQIFPGDRLFIRTKTSGVPAPAPPSIPYQLADDVQYYQPAPPAAPDSVSLPNYYKYVRPQLDLQRSAASPSEKQPLSPSRSPGERPSPESRSTGPVE